ncbi:transporter substrate-binding domain-containing protein [Aeromonas salmonicida]|uniref:transporter substrate-binding domain-containing protein n=1 Tax=Aeromonas salmonicida TaxID=645 RepID=UPI00186503C9|nr:transporter substrate-binding domain-containing protein [Aeromonas salmonicida]
MKSWMIGLLLALSTFGAHAASVTAAQDPWPPFVIDANKGISVELVKRALATQGYELDMRIMPWARALSEVEEGNIDILVGAWFTEARTKSLRFSDEYLKNQVKFIQLAGGSFELNGLASLKGKSIGIVRGYGYGDDFMQAELNRQEAGDLPTNLKKLLDGRIDLTLEDEVVARAIMAQQGMDASKFAFTANALSTNPLHIASGVKNPRGQELIEAFNKGLAIISTDGTMDQILTSYGVK